MLRLFEQSVELTPRETTAFIIYHNEVMGLKAHTWKIYHIDHSDMPASTQHQESAFLGL